MTQLGASRDRNAEPAADRRQYPRVRLTPDLRTASLQSLSGDSIALPVLDLSPSGVAVAAFARPSWMNGRADLALRAGDERIPCRAEEARVSQSGDAPVYGLRLYLDECARPAMARTYHRLRFEALRRRNALQHSTLKTLFTASGYLGLKEGLVPSSVWLQADWPSTLTHDAVYLARDGRALGHVTVTRAYPSAWLGHEIATLRDHPEALACRRMLYQHFSIWPRLMDGEEAHLLGYYNRARPWHRRMFEDFAARCRPTECLVLPMDRYTVAPLEETQPTQSARAGEARVVFGSNDDASRVVRLIEPHWPVLARRAFDIQKDRLISSCLHTAYRDEGLNRSRTVLLLQVRGETVGAALCEWSDSQISLFNVLNMAQVFLDSRQTVSEPACNLLVQAVRRFYVERGAPPPLLACPPGTFKNVQLSGCTLAETMGCIIWNAEGLRLFESYVDDTLSDARVEST